ncbi:MAG: hypothetical protein HUJ68_08890, partial [Clostridia bacterium]|nr:hypothetical protein [Clostridia bacterium]
MQCKICNIECTDLKHLAIHIRTKHNMTAKDYYDKFFKTETDGFCKHCKKPTSFLGLHKGYKKFCCIKCTANSDEIKEKKKLTCIKKYGVENPLQSQTVQEKSKATLLEKYGVE